MYYKINVGDLANSYETEDFYTALGDDSAIQIAQIHVSKTQRENPLWGVKLIGLDRLVYVKKEIELDDTTPVSLPATLK